MRNSELEEKRKNNCENIWHVQKKVVSLQCQNKGNKEQNKNTYRDGKKRINL